MSKTEEPQCIYRNSNEPVEVRVRDLLSRMMLREKLGQMTQIERSVANPSAIRDLCIGSVLSGGGSAPFDGASATDWADMVDSFQKAAIQSRLGVPILYATDAVHGHNNVYGATIFPHNIGLGATRFHWLRQVCKDPRWGRCYESFSEDTEVVRKMTLVVVGLQGLPPEGHPKGYPYVAGRKNVIACAKHFIGDGGTDRGINEGNTILSFDELERNHMEPYLECLSQGVSTIMASYSSWNGRKLHSDYFLLTCILKGKLGFKGFVISDWEGIDRLSQPHGSNYHYCISASINAGVDMVMVPFRYNEFMDALVYLVESGEIPMSRIDDAVERILRVKFVAGLFEHPFTDRSLLDMVGCKMHRKLAQEAVRKSLVLLKNGKDPAKPLLPFDRKAQRILVAGRHADDLGLQCGGWSITWQGSSGRITTGTTILDGIKEAVGDETEVIYEECPSPATFVGQGFSFAIVIVGEATYVESMGDNSELTIPFNGIDMVNLVADRVPTLVILISGRPLVLEPWLLERMEALVAAWLPGSEGRGVADVIFGDYDFEGLLPMSWPRMVDQLPLNKGDQSYDPLFPLGFGLRTK
ncbi:PREDICTED: uncharacterized protein LOC104596995 isoform X2 [Nelumbo nucifera]|uniref:Uncharacterized protein LOC104596995 isoform X2 n=1 Tax=Nelumbo nucifera TaxID=4432 RepID=A0A1U7ZQY3_NELNU|nr:PREDICTED: uncharacterized protein LOC104596995 isoform X2 [Nelumbo nucifera]